ncbi:MAG: ABC transporter substrate-binding protein [Azospirillaceae bacterium]
MAYRHLNLALPLLAGTLLASPALAQTEIRIMWYSDGNEGEVVADLLERFEAEHPEIDIVLDEVAYQTIQENLPVQLESGRGPDIARVTNLQTLNEHWLDLRPHLSDPAYWEENFGSFLDWMRPAGSDAIPGFVTQLTVTGPFINATLFQQAGVEVPEQGATWEEWIPALRQVAEATGVPIPLAMDRSGHRFSGPAISYGAQLIDDEGNPVVPDDGIRAMAENIVNWHQDGTMAQELWGGVSGTTYVGANQEFANAEVVMYFSGSWQIAQFANQIGDAFDWWAVPNPCGTAACTGMAGGAGLVGIAYTEHPEEVATVMEYLASEPVIREFTARTLFLPAHAGLASSGVDYVSDDPNVARALDVFLAEVGRLEPKAIAMQAYRFNSILYGAIITRLGQVVAGELTLDDALARMEVDIADQIAEASR